MATKGPSNKYGNSRGGRQGHDTKQIGFSWAKAFNKSTLQRHFEDHGMQMGTPTKEAYNAKAVRFANTVDKKNCKSFIDKHDSTYKYNKKTNELAIITKKGIVITYYKPKEGNKYYLKQRREKNKYGKK